MIRSTDVVRYRLPPFRVEARHLALSEVIDWGLANLNIPDQWRETRGAGIIVAVLDTGCEATHPDLAGALIDARDFTRSPSGTLDRVGHGTHVAGIIGARKNDRGVVGVAPECRLLNAKVLDDQGSGADTQVAAGIDWAVDSGADLLSLSLGGPQPSRPIEQAIERAIARGRFVICAAGNQGLPNSIEYPGRLPQTVSVGAVDRYGRRAPFSSQGDQLDLCAPGQDILSTHLRGTYATLSGTSMAAPFVTGVVALLLSKHRQRGGATPVTNAGELLEHLRRTAADVGLPGKDPAYGYGLIDPARVLAPVEASLSPVVEWGPVTVNGVRGTFRFIADALGGREGT